MPTQPDLDFSGRNWPDPLQRLLLRACLGTGESAIAAWREWQGRIALDDIDYASLRLIPLLSHQLRQAGVEHPDLGRYRGIYRKSWYENQVLFRLAAQVTQLCQAAGIPVLVLKGVPLAHFYYAETALRPMTDFDFLVRPHQAEAARVALQGAGWILTSNQHPVRGSKEWSFTHPDGGTIDLHWRLGATSFARDAEDAYWRDAEKFSLNGIATLTLCPTDHFFHACVHGVPANWMAPFRWMTDAMMILRKREIDWDRLLALAQSHRVTFLLRHALHYLRTQLDAPIPDEILERIALLPIEPWEPAELRVMRRPGLRTLYWRILWYDFQRFRLSTAGECPPGFTAAYGYYVHARFGHVGVWLMPVVALRKIARHLKRLLTLRFRAARRRPTPAPPQSAGDTSP